MPHVPVSAIPHESTRRFTAVHQVLDAEEYDVLMRIKELKSSYKENYNELQVVKSEVDYTQV